MLRSRPLLLAALVLLPSLLASLPTGTANHLDGVVSNNDIISTEPDPVRLGVGATEIRFNRDTADASARSYVATSGGNTVLKSGDLSKLTVFFNNADNPPPGKKCTGTGELPRWRVNWTHPTLFTHRIDGVADTAEVTASPTLTPVKPITAADADFVTHSTAEAANALGYRTADVTVYANATCVVKQAGTEVSEDVKYTWRFDLKNVRIDNTRPDLGVFLNATPSISGGYGSRNIAKIGDAFTLAFAVNDLDWRNSRDVCVGDPADPLKKGYNFTVPFDRITGPTKDNDFVEAAHFAPGSATSCLRSLTYPRTGIDTSFVLGDLANGYDYDQVPGFTGSRFGNQSGNPNPALQPLLRFNLTDEWGNMQTVALQPRVDTVAPAAPVFHGNPAPLSGGTARVTWSNSALSPDVVDLKIEYRVDTGAWQTIPGVTGGIVARDFASPSTQFVVTNSLVSSPSTVEFRLTAIDDAGNPSTPKVSNPILLDPSAPSATLTDADRVPLVGGTFHSFATFHADVADAEGIPFQTLSREHVWLRIWKNDPVQGRRYWDDQNTSFGGSEYRIPSTLPATYTPTGDGKVAAALYKFQLAACVTPAPGLEPCGQFGTGTYYAELRVRDAAGNVVVYPPHGNGLALDRDFAKPTFESAGSLNKLFNVPASNQIQQGAYVQAGLHVRDGGSGFKEIRFAWVPPGTPDDRHDLAVRNVWGKPAVACLAPLQTVNGAPVAYAAVPDGQTGTCPAHLLAHTAEEIRAFPHFACLDAGPCAQFRSLYDRDPTSAKLQTPFVNVSTDGLPFGNYQLNVQLVDWAGQKTSKTFTGTTVTVGPRIVQAARNETNGIPQAVLQDGKVSLAVYASYTDDRDLSGSACQPDPTLSGAGEVLTYPAHPTLAPLALATRTAACVPTKVVFSYKPAGENAYREITTLSLPSRPTPDSPDYNLDPYKPYTVHPLLKDAAGAPAGTRFWRFALDNFTLPSGAPGFPDPAIVRVTVTATTSALKATGELEERTQASFVDVQLGATFAPSALVPLKPLASWPPGHEATFFKPTSGSRAAGQLGDLWFQYEFQRDGLKTEDTLVRYRIYSTEPEKLEVSAGSYNVSAAAACTGTPTVCTYTDSGLDPGLYYYRVSAWGASGETARSREFVVRVGAGQQPSALDTTTPSGAPALLSATTTATSATIKWNATGAANYAVYRGAYVGAPATLTSTERVQLGTYRCDVAWPENPQRPCRLVYENLGKPDDPRTGKKWSAWVNVTDKARIDLVTNAPTNPDDDAVRARDTKYVGSPPAPDNAYRVNLTRGAYVLHLTAHPEANLLSTYGNVTRTFHVETRAPTIEFTPMNAYPDPQGTLWTRDRLWLKATVDVGTAVNTDEGDVKVGIRPATSADFIPGVVASVQDRSVEDVLPYDGRREKVYHINVTLPSAFTHGTSFRVAVNATADATPAFGSSSLLAQASRFPFAVDTKAPTVRFDMVNTTVDGGTRVDGEFKFHGKIDDGLGSGVNPGATASEAKVQVAVRQTYQGDTKYWKPSTARFETMFPDQYWITLDTTGFDATTKVWSWPVPTALKTAILDKKIENHTVLVRVFDNMGNGGAVATARPVYDAKPPAIPQNSNATVPGTQAYVKGTKFFVNASDASFDPAQKDKVKVWFLAPNEKAYSVNLTANAGCGTTCFSATLTTDLRWAGTYRYWFSAVDKYGNSWCSYGPCGAQVDTSALPTFTLADDGAPKLVEIPEGFLSDRRDADEETHFWDPRFVAEGGVARIVVNVQEASNFSAGYPKAVLYVNDTEVGNGTMYPWKGDRVDDVAGFGLWAFSSDDLGVDLKSGQEVCVVVLMIDREDNFASSTSTPGKCKDLDAKVVENAPPIATVLSPTPVDGVRWVGRDPVVTVKFDDVNLDPAKFRVAVTQNGTTADGSARLTWKAINVTSLTGDRVVGYEVTYKGANFSQGNATFEFTGTDTFGVSDNATVEAKIDPAPPVPSLEIDPVANVDGKDWVGPQSSVTLAGSDPGGGSGLARLEYSVNGGSWTAFTAAFKVTGGDTFRISYRAVDGAGNVGVGPEATYAIDRAAPTVTVVKAGSNTTITAVDALTGVNGERVSLRYKTSTESTDFGLLPFEHVTGDTYTASLGPLSGTFLYYVEVEDKVGNVGLATVGGKTCTAESPCRLGDAGKEPPTIAFEAPDEGATLSGEVEVGWSAVAFEGAAAKIRIELVNATERLLVRDGVTELTGTHRFDPAALGAAAGAWRIVLTIDDGVNDPVTAQRSVTLEVRAVVVGAFEKTPPAIIRPGETFETRVPIAETDKQAVRVKATIFLGNQQVKEETYTVQDGAIQFKFAESAVGTYSVYMAVEYADGTSDEPVKVATMNVRSATPTPPGPDGLGIRPYVLLVLGAAVVALAAAGAFWRWKP